jgi:hypothetical protein
MITPEMASPKQDSSRKREFYPNVCGQDAATGVHEHIKSIPLHHSHILELNVSTIYNEYYLPCHKGNGKISLTSNITE